MLGAVVHLYMPEGTRIDIARAPMAGRLARADVQYVQPATTMG
jgi:hypothetical protein